MAFGIIQYDSVAVHLNRQIVSVIDNLTLMTHYTHFILSSGLGWKIFSFISIHLMVLKGVNLVA